MCPCSLRLARRDELVLRAMRFVLVVCVLFVSGCVSTPPHTAEEGGSDDIVLRMEIASIPATAILRVGTAEMLALPDGRSTVATPVEIRIVGGGDEAARVAHFGPGGGLVKIGDIELQEFGSEQYIARTRQWTGSPAGHLDPFRCLAGILLPLAAANPSASTVELGAFAIWEPASGRLLDGAASAGTASVDEGRGWPRKGAWQHPDGRSCAILDVERARSASPFHEGGPPLSLRREGTATLQHGRPPVGALTLPLSLESADDAARSHLLMKSFLRDHPQAWLYEVHFEGPLGAAGVGRWTLAYGDPIDGARTAAEVENGPLGPIALEVTRLPEAPVATPSSLGALHPLASQVESLASAAPRSGDDVRISWFTQVETESEPTADRAVWQIIRTRAGYNEIFVFSATDGVALARVYGVPTLW